MDAYDTRKKNWEDLDVTKEELNSFTECLKKEEFRKLLIEYAEEVSNPENRKIYEKEITELEKERGVDVTFVNPEPGYVIKTSLNGDKKCFVNISKSVNVGKPSSQPSYEDGHRGLQWSIPYSLSPPREDYDKKNVRCTVFDVVFHPDTLYLASKNPRFADLVNNTAMDGVQSNFKVKLDRKNIKFPKMSFKGVGQPTVIRKTCEKPSESSLDLEPEIYQKLMASYDESREKQVKRNEEKPSRAQPTSVYYKDTKPKIEDCDSIYATPKFTIKHQSDVDLQDFRDCPDAKINAAIPKRLVIVIDLPLLKSANDAALDVQERSLVVQSEKPAKYRLKLPLPYCVDADNGYAKFDVKYKKLTVTLPVIRKNLTLADVRDDSGVESDHGSPLLGSGDEIMASSNRTDSSELDSSIQSNFNSEPPVTAISQVNGVENSCDDTALRTNDTVDYGEPLVNPNIKYTLPPFVCNVYDENLAVTINVKNVDSESIRYRPLRANSGIHIVLSSVGAGFFPVYYSLCLKIHENSIVPESVTVEPWDNNVVFTIGLKDTKNLSRYFVGIDEEFMEAKDLPSAMSLTNKFQELTVDEQSESEKTIRVIAEGEDIVINIQSNNLDSDDEDDHKPLDRASRKKERKHGLSKTRSVSESSGDELPSSNASSLGNTKGILKSRRSTFSRSVSESSIDDTTGLVSSVDFHYDSIHDINSESDCSSFKKSVRFNDVVSRQLYRSNSSILGQRKKNQRKLRNKKRAHERRMSESENSETEDREKYRINSRDDTSEQKSHDTVKPILNRDKLSENKKTDTIEIAKFQTNINNHSHKTKRDTIVSDENSEKVLPEANECHVGDAAGTEFKNDLIFDLDM